MARVTGFAILVPQLAACTPHHRVDSGIAPLDFCMVAHIILLERWVIYSISFNKYPTNSHSFDAQCERPAQGAGTARPAPRKVWWITADKTAFGGRMAVSVVILQMSLFDHIESIIARAVCHLVVLQGLMVLLQERLGQ